MIHPSPPHTWLALGDSYTIGEAVPLFESYPYQAVQLLRHAGCLFSAPEIIARTGWTTGELEQGIAQTLLQPVYDIVSLLIGVNNQYRGYPPEDYAAGFEQLLQQALASAGNQPQRVFVLSIPDWGATPFAADRQNDPTAVSAAIDRFNQINRSISLRHGVHYIDITPGSRLAISDASLLAADQLHYSGKEYARWAALLAPAIRNALQQG
ncbi:MAG TPA: SGNH/GDSL hydrolase family protein [Chitinophagaceae bacterium]|nr:SGNH/GDSL hydrolase family protein [Chitinophagaceae bacterium]